MLAAGVRPQERFRFGKYRSIRNQECGTFNGRKLWQFDDYSVKSSMEVYIELPEGALPLEGADDIVSVDFQATNQQQQSRAKRTTTSD